jgi:hypothetical protein
VDTAILGSFVFQGRTVNLTDGDVYEVQQRGYGDILGVEQKLVRLQRKDTKGKTWMVFQFTAPENFDLPMIRLIAEENLFNDAFLFTVAGPHAWVFRKCPSDQLH